MSAPSISPTVQQTAADGYDAGVAAMREQVADVLSTLYTWEANASAAAFTARACRQRDLPAEHLGRAQGLRDAIAALAQLGIH